MTPPIDVTQADKDVLIANIRALFMSGYGDGDDRYNDALDTAIEAVRRFYEARPTPAPSNTTEQACEIAALRNALTLARNRLQRVALDLPSGSGERLTCNEWADEATAALTQEKPDVI